MTLYIAFDKLKNGHRLRSVARIFYTKEKMGKMMQFRVPSGSAPELLSSFSVDHFSPGQFVDVVGTSIGKGFAGGRRPLSRCGCRQSR